MADEHETEERTGPQRPPRLRNLARRIFREIDPESSREGVEGELDDEPGSASAAANGGEARSGRTGSRSERERHRGDAWALLGAVLETGDKAKSEMVRMLAREVRTYLEALELHKDLHHLLTNYSLEVNASFNLKPLADAVATPSSEAPAEADTAESSLVPVPVETERQPQDS